MSERSPVRQLRADDQTTAKPIYVVWEITMKCDQPCQHCGSRAGRARPSELTTAEILDVARGLVRLGTREVTLIGGEAYLREDCADIIRFLTDKGIRVSMQTGGRAFTIERARKFKDAGLDSLGVSIDGLARSHDKLRGNLGSYSACMRAIDNAREVGLVVTANTQVNKLNMNELRPLAEELKKRGVQVWQVQLTGPLGRAADRAEWLLDPWEVVPVIDTLAAIQLESQAAWDGTGIPFNVLANNNLGYFGPHEQLVRSRPLGGDAHWSGCPAGIFTMGIESDGTVKACPTLPTEPYDGGNVRDMTIEGLWQMSQVIRFARDRTLEELWGFCKTCYYADQCRGGCSWMAHTTLGKRGNNPFCYHRVIQLKKKGVREKLVPVEAAPQRPYDFGRFEIKEEPWSD
ncbi:MAG: radical SAM protein [Polyangiaceae bacterium]|nr:radical SAM protein [Polyangiaceae bacterium]